MEDSDRDLAILREYGVDALFEEVDRDNKATKISIFGYGEYKEGFYDFEGNLVEYDGETLYDVDSAQELDPILLDMMVFIRGFDEDEPDEEEETGIIIKTEFEFKADCCYLNALENVYKDVSMEQTTENALLNHLLVERSYNTFPGHYPKYCPTCQQLLVATSDNYIEGYHFDSCI